MKCCYVSEPQTVKHLKTQKYHLLAKISHKSLRLNLEGGLICYFSSKDFLQMPVLDKRIPFGKKCKTTTPLLEVVVGNMFAAIPLCYAV